MIGKKRRRRRIKIKIKEREAKEDRCMSFKHRD